MLVACPQLGAHTIRPGDRVNGPGNGQTGEGFDMKDHSFELIHDDEAGVLCTCEYCQNNGRCEDAPCCGCCDPGRIAL